jgi:hypothetical protein
MKKKMKITPKELKDFLKYKVLELDCGHKFQLHPFSNTMIVYNNGKMECHNCR